MQTSNVVHCYETDFMVPSVRSNKVIIFVILLGISRLPAVACVNFKANLREVTCLLIYYLKVSVGRYKYFTMENQ